MGTQPKRNITIPQDLRQDLKIAEVTLEVEQAVPEGAFRGTRGLNVHRHSKAPQGTCHISEGIAANKGKKKVSRRVVEKSFSTTSLIVTLK